VSIVAGFVIGATIQPDVTTAFFYRSRSAITAARNATAAASPSSAAAPPAASSSAASAVPYPKHWSFLAVPSALSRTLQSLAAVEEQHSDAEVAAAFGNDACTNVWCALCVSFV
jgi:hypothetical protein